MNTEHMLMFFLFETSALGMKNGISCNETGSNFYIFLTYFLNMVKVRLNYIGSLPMKVYSPLLGSYWRAMSGERRWWLLRHITPWEKFERAFH